MSKIIVSFEVTEELRNFIRDRAKMHEQSRSGYLRSLVIQDQTTWHKETQLAWAKWQQPIDNFGVKHGN